MSLGVVFAVLFFAFLAPVPSLAYMHGPDLAHRALGALTGGVGWAILPGLVTRQPWARWAGIGAATAVCASVLRLIALRSLLVDLVVLMAGLGTVVFLLLPATGAYARQTRTGTVGRGRVYGAVVTALLAAQVVLAGYVLAVPAVAVDPATAATATPVAPATAVTSPAPWAAATAASAAVTPASHAPAAPVTKAPAPRAESAPAAGEHRNVPWRSFGPGLEAARKQGKPLLVHFFASWCGYCRKMDAVTFADSEVVEGLAKAVTAKVDGEEVETRDGFRGAELASKYGVRIYPTHVLLDGEGRIVARVAGYMEPREFLAWFKLSLARAYQQSLAPPPTSGS